LLSMTEKSHRCPCCRDLPAREPTARSFKVCNICHQHKSESYRASAKGKTTRAKHHCSSEPCKSFASCPTKHQKFHPEEVRKERQEKKSSPKDDKKKDPKAQHLAPKTETWSAFRRNTGCEQNKSGPQHFTAVCSAARQFLLLEEEKEAKANLTEKQQQNREKRKLEWSGRAVVSPEKVRELTERAFEFTARAKRPRLEVVSTPTQTRGDLLGGLAVYPANLVKLLTISTVPTMTPLCRRQTRPMIEELNPEPAPLSPLHGCEDEEVLARAIERLQAKRTSLPTFLLKAALQNAAEKADSEQPPEGIQEASVKNRPSNEIPEKMAIEDTRSAPTSPAKGSKRDTLRATTLRNMEHWRKSLESESPELAKRLARGSLRDDGSSNDYELSKPTSSSSPPSPVNLSDSGGELPVPANGSDETAKKLAHSASNSELRKPRSHSASEALKGTIRRMRGTLTRQFKKKTENASKPVEETPAAAAPQSIFDLADSQQDLLPPSKSEIHPESVNK